MDQLAASNTSTFPSLKAHHSFGFPPPSSSERPRWPTKHTRSAYWTSLNSSVSFWMEVHSSLLCHRPLNTKLTQSEGGCVSTYTEWDLHLCWTFPPSALWRIIRWISQKHCKIFVLSQSSCCLSLHILFFISSSSIYFALIYVILCIIYKNILLFIYR